MPVQSKMSFCQVNKNGRKRKGSYSFFKGQEACFRAWNLIKIHLDRAKNFLLS